MVIVVGATGLLGPYLMEAAASLGEVVGAARKNADVLLDVTNRAAVTHIFKRLKPDIVIHAAAMTDVDGCENDPQGAYRVNQAGVSNIGDSLPAHSHLVYISTDQVYPSTGGPHKEGGASPVNVYGRSKFDGEKEALRHPGALVLRTNVFGPSRTQGRASLSDFVIDSLAAGKEITLFEDILFSPLHMRTLGEMLVLCVKHGLCGTYNMGSRAGLSKKDFAFLIASRRGLSTRKASIGESSQIPGRAPRPRDMRMDVSCIEKALKRTMPTLKEEIAKL